MLFPIIEVRDKGSRGRTHVVGTNQHDMLIVNKHTGAIEYYNLQNGDGTGVRGGYEFTGKKNEYYGLTVRFVEFDELKEIYELEKRKDEEHRKAMEKLFPGCVVIS